jgi:nucleoside-diphosphate-sugar epimerase
MTRVLVTGASGFIGRHTLAPLAAGGLEVRAAARHMPRDRALVSAVAQWHTADLRDPVAARELIAAVRPTHLLHLAWNAEPRVYWTAPDNLDWVAGTLALVRAFREAGGERFVGAGTCAEYDWDALDGPCLEGQTPLHPRTLYGAAKLAAWTAIEAYARQTGLCAAWGRLFLLYGPHEPASRLAPSVIRALLAGERPACTDGSQIRDFTYVQDAAEAFATLLFSSAEGAINVASGRAMSIREFVGHIVSAVESDVAVDFGARPRPSGDPDLLIADTSRLQAAGFAAGRTLQDALRETVTFWRNRLPPASGT